MRSLFNGKEAANLKAIKMPGSIAGFTYLELMIGLSLFLLSLTFLMGSYRMAARNVSAARDFTDRAAAAQSAAEIYKTSRNTAAVKSAVEPDYSKQDYTIAVDDSQVIGRMTYVIITVEGGNGNPYNLAFSMYD